MMESLSAAVAQIQAGVKLIDQSLAALDTAEAQAVARWKEAVKSAELGEKRVVEMRAEMRSVVTMLEQAKAAAEGKAEAIIKAAKVESARIVEEAQKRRDEIRELAAAEREVLVEAQEKARAASVEWTDLRNRIAAAKEKARQAFGE